MDTLISRDIEGSTVTVILAEGDTSQASVYLDKKRVAKATWDGASLTEIGGMMPADPWAKRAYAIMAQAIREHAATVAGVVLAPWADVAARLQGLSAEAVKGDHATAAVVALSLAGMALDDIAERLNMAAMVESTTGAGGTWNKQERTIILAAVAALRAGPLNPADWQAQDGADL